MPYLIGGGVMAMFGTSVPLTALNSLDKSRARVLKGQTIVVLE